MPELPEVETTVNGLRDTQPPIQGASFIDVWSNSPQIIKKPKNVQWLRRRLVGLKIKGFRRRGKNILIDLSSNKTLLIHQKLSGHLLYGHWEYIKDGWKPTSSESLKEKMNLHIRVVFTLDNGYMVALSDIRKFAKIELWDTENLEIELDRALGPEPLDNDFTFDKFERLFDGRTALIKSLLLNQGVLVGIGNIYADEILWMSKIHPFRRTNTLSRSEFRRIYENTRKILKRAIYMKGTSISDYRTIQGELGEFEKTLNVYQREDKECKRCSTHIMREKRGVRSTRFCPVCQLYPRDK